MKDTIHPGEILLEEFIKPSGLSITETAKLLCVSRKHLSQIVNKKAGIGAVMAIKLSKLYNTSPKVWTGIQSDYQLSQTLK